MINIIVEYKFGERWKSMQCIGVANAELLLRAVNRLTVGFAASLVEWRLRVRA